MDLEKIIKEIKDTSNIKLSSNFNEEIERELSELNLGGKCVPIAEQDKGTRQDYVNLENRIYIRTEENRKMMEQSLMQAKFNSLPLGCEQNKELVLKKKML